MLKNILNIKQIKQAAEDLRPLPPEKQNMVLYEAEQYYFTEPTADDRAVSAFISGRAHQLLVEPESKPIYLK